MKSKNNKTKKNKTKKLKGGKIKTIEEAINTVSKNGLSLQIVPVEFKDKYEVVNAAITQNGLALQFASDKDSTGIVDIAVSQNGLALQFASERLKLDDGLVRVAVSQNGLALQFAGERLHDDGGIVHDAVRQNGMALEFASKRLQNDGGIVNTAIEYNGMALQFASKELQSNVNTVNIAVYQNGMALQFASKEVQNDVGIIYVAVVKNGLALEFVSEEFQGYEPVVRTSVGQNGMALQFASKELQNDKGIVHAAVRQNGLALEFASEGLKDDVDTVHVAVIQNGMALQFASVTIKNNKPFVNFTVNHNGLALEFASKELQDDIETVHIATAQNRSALQFASTRIKNLLAKNPAYQAQLFDDKHGLSAESSVRGRNTEGYLLRSSINSVLPFFVDQGDEGTCVFVTTAKVLLFNLVGLFTNIELTPSEKQQLDTLLSSKEFKLNSDTTYFDKDLQRYHEQCSPKGLLLIILFYYFFDWLKKHDLRPYLILMNRDFELFTKNLTPFEKKMDFNHFLTLFPLRLGGLHFSGTGVLERFLPELHSNVEKVKLNYKTVNICTLKSIYTENVVSFTEKEFEQLLTIITKLTSNNLRLSLTMLGPKKKDSRHHDLHDVMIVGIEKGNLLISNSWGQVIDKVPIEILPTIQLILNKKIITAFSAFIFKILLPVTDAMNIDFKVHYDSSNFDDLIDKIDEYMVLYKQYIWDKQPKLEQIDLSFMDGLVRSSFMGGNKM
jgi:hypothetical protein